jgi:YebC/PmpR family DNA-binding regulatory protein
MGIIQSSIAMSGHSHFSTIKRQKAANDAVKGNLFSKMARNIMIAAKGGPDPDMNFKLRVEIDKARAVSMPRENIDRAISKATTEAASLEEISYEGFGPNGLNVIVEAATNNKNRTAQEIKGLFDRGGGGMGGPGSVSFNFEHKGFLFVKKTSDSEEEMLKLIDAGVEDISESPDGFDVYTSVEKLSETKKKIEEMGFEIATTELQMKPKNLFVVKDKEEAERVMTFLESLEENEDVSKVFSNLEIPDEVMIQISAE